MEDNGRKYSKLYHYNFDKDANHMYWRTLAHKFKWGYDYDDSIVNNLARGE